MREAGSLFIILILGLYFLRIHNPVKAANKLLIYLKSNLTI